MDRVCKSQLPWLELLEFEKTRRRQPDAWVQVLTKSLPPPPPPPPMKTKTHLGSEPECAPKQRHLVVGNELLESYLQGWMGHGAAAIGPFERSTAAAQWPDQHFRVAPGTLTSPNHSHHQLAAANFCAPVAATLALSSSASAPARQPRSGRSSISNDRTAKTSCASPAALQRPPQSLPVAGTAHRQCGPPQPWHE